MSAAVLHSVEDGTLSITMDLNVTVNTTGCAWLSITLPTTELREVGQLVPGGCSLTLQQGLRLAGGRAGEPRPVLIGKP